MGPPIHLNVVHVAILGTAIALFYLAVNWLVGVLGLADSPVGKAILNVYPA